jgi:aminopeptidase N
MLGDEAFRKGVHAFMDRWHGKHPIPWDFFYTFNDVTGKNLNWFWNSWYFSNGYVDLAISSVTRAGDGYIVTISNIGGFPVPFDLDARYSDGTSAVIHRTSGVWEANPRAATVSLPAKKTLQTLGLNTSIWLDADSTNNRWQGAPTSR